MTPPRVNDEEILSSVDKGGQMSDFARDLRDCRKELKDVVQWLLASNLLSEMSIAQLENLARLEEKYGWDEPTA